MKKNLKYRLSEPTTALEIIKELPTGEINDLSLFDMNRSYSPVAVVLDNSSFSSNWINVLQEVLKLNWDKNQPIEEKKGEKKYILQSILDGGHLGYEMSKHSLSLIETAVNHGANINLVDHDGNTPVLHAIKFLKLNHATAALAKFIELGADLTIKDKSGIDVLGALKNKATGLEVSLDKMLKGKDELIEKLENVFPNAITKNKAAQDEGETISRRGLKV